MASLLTYVITPASTLVNLDYYIFMIAELLKICNFIEVISAWNYKYITTIEGALYLLFCFIAMSDGRHVN
jgi:hypothetical protein